MHDLSMEQLAAIQGAGGTNWREIGQGAALGATAGTIMGATLGAASGAGVFSLPGALIGGGLGAVGGALTGAMGAWAGGLRRPGDVA